MVPVAALPPATPFTVQETAVLDAPVTEAVNCCVPGTVTVSELGEIEIDGVIAALLPEFVVVPEPVLPVPSVPEEDVLPVPDDEPVLPVPAVSELLADVGTTPRPHPDNKRASDKVAKRAMALLGQWEHF
jgi:hypothetical protein